MTQPYALHLLSLDLLILDSADADDDKAPPEKVLSYRTQLSGLLAEAPVHSWLLTHRPVWAPAEGAYATHNAVLNLTEQTALATLSLDPIDLVVSGHVHSFIDLDYGPEHPAQLVVGTGGDLDDQITNVPIPGALVGNVQLHRAFAMSDYGFLVLDRTDMGWRGAFYGVDNAPRAYCTITGRRLECSTEQTFLRISSEPPAPRNNPAG